MRYATFAFLIFLFISVIFIYALNNISPWNQEQVALAIARYEINTGSGFTEFVNEALSLGLIWNLLDFKNLLMIIILMGGSVVSGFVGIHLIMDKLFFRKFYEEPSVFVAVRRGVLVYLVIVGIIFLNLIAGLVWYNALAVVIIGASVEFAAINYFREREKE